MELNSYSCYVTVTRSTLRVYKRIWGWQLAVKTTDLIQLIWMSATATVCWCFVHCLLYLNVNTDLNIAPLHGIINGCAKNRILFSLLFSYDMISLYYVSLPNNFCISRRVFTKQDVNIIPLATSVPLNLPRQDFQIWHDNTNLSNAAINLVWWGKLTKNWIWSCESLYEADHNKHVYEFCQKNRSAV